MKHPSANAYGETIDESAVIASLEAVLGAPSEANGLTPMQEPTSDTLLGRHEEKIMRLAEMVAGLALGDIVVRTVGIEAPVGQAVTCLSVAGSTSQAIRLLAPRLAGYVSREHRPGPIRQVQSATTKVVDRVINGSANYMQSRQQG